MFRQLNDHCIRIVILNKEYTKIPFFLTTTKTFSIHRSAFLSRKRSVETRLLIITELRLSPELQNLNSGGSDVNIVRKGSNLFTSSFPRTINI